MPRALQRLLCCYTDLHQLTVGTELRAHMTRQLRNDLLTRQVQEMERFLNDYGLVWVGYRTDRDGADSSDATATTKAAGCAPQSQLQGQGPAATQAQSSAPAGAEAGDLYFKMDSMAESIRVRRSRWLVR